MRLIDADRLIDEGYILIKRGESRSTSISDVPTAFDLEKVLGELEEEHQDVIRAKKRCNGEDKLRMNYLIGKHCGILDVLDVIKEVLEDE